MSAGDINNELLQGFTDESIDSLAAIDNLFVKLEANPTDIEIVNSIFRPIHSLKGNAAYFGLMKIKKLAHTMENLLDSIRKEQHHADRPVIDMLLLGVDLLKEMLSAVRDGNPELVDEKPFHTILTGIETILGTRVTALESGRIPLVIDKIRLHISSEGVSMLDDLVQILSSIPMIKNLKTGQSESKSSVPDPFDINTTENKLHTILKSKSSFRSGDDAIGEITDLLRQLQVIHGSGPASKVVRSMEDIFYAFTGADTGLDDLAIAMLLEKLAEIKTNSTATSIPATISNKDETEPAKEKILSKSQHTKSMRIPEQALDDFLRCVGELLGVEEMLRHVSRQVNSGVDTYTVSSTLKNVTGQFESISKELRQKIMDVRKVEAMILLQKPPRIVRDISTVSGKKIEVECIGEDLRIDKSYIDLFDAPLTHMVRNAADHGIELPAQRLANGKKETGKIIVTVTEKADDLLLTVQDDGAGLDYQALQKKAFSLGIIAKDAKLSETDVVDLLFKSGVSTARVVTDVSGRGVGMDVVKRAIVDAGGKIEVSSTPGQGSLFTVSVPRNASTQILDGYMVRSFSNEMYILPLGSVIEAFSVLSQEISGVTGKTKILTRKGTVYPFHTLDSLLGVNTAFQPTGIDSGAMGIVVEWKKNKTVIAVKEVLGIQKVVCKPIEGSMLDNSVFDGAAISGTGHVSMIVNLENLLKI